ncbi:MAG: nickel-dependent hydrogenase large subunit [Coriobacteriales bacterium]|jgi:NADH-quinone oxidoreductase subunit D|nr:nickel-dependent hydrogenase large subunit [Coriobacteriales bacterium]
MAKVEIPIGPQHPALKEPENFVLSLDGERIVGAAVNLGYNHRGVEKGCEGRNYTQCLYLIERVCGICSHSHSTSFSKAVEELAGIEVPRRAHWIRSLVGELERLHSHMLWLGVAGHELGFDTLFMLSWRDRELVLDLLAKITGNRVNYGANKLGGVRSDIDDKVTEEIRVVIKKFSEAVKYYIEVVTTEPTLAARMLGVGKLSHEDAVTFGAAGPVARAANVDRDVRRDDPYAAYDEIPFDVITDDHADVFGRAIVRAKEMAVSCEIILYIIDNIPDGELITKIPRKIPEGEVFSRYEAPRGEDVHFIKSNGSDKPERVKVRAPTSANAASIALMLQDNYLADAPIIIAAIDPCFSCTDRSIALIDHSSGREGMLDWRALRQYSVDWYKNQGISFDDLSKSLSKRM